MSKGGRVREGTPAAEGAADLKAQSKKEWGVLEQWGMATADGAQIKTARKGTGGPEPDHKARARGWDSILS